MSMHAMKTEATATAVPVVSPAMAAPVVTMTPKQAPRAEKYLKMAKEAAARVVPPLVVLALLMLFWELVCRRTGSTLPPPSKVFKDTKELILDPFFDNGGIDKGLFWHLSASLQRVAYGYSIAAVVGIALGTLVGQSIWAMRGLDPLFQVLRTIPPLAWLPLSLAAFRDGQPSAIFVTSSPRSGRSSSTPRSASATSRRTIATSQPSCSSIRWSCLLYTSDAADE